MAAVGVASSAWASSVAPGPVSVELNRAFAVFAGVVQARRDSVVLDTSLSGLVGETEWGTILVVKALRSWKGLRADSVVTMMATSDTGAAPESAFVVGERYLIYAGLIEPAWRGRYAGWVGRLFVSGRTMPLWMAAADLRQLGLVAIDSAWLRGSAPSSLDSLQIIPLADSLARRAH
jgi:hypothetical protein